MEEKSIMQLFKEASLSLKTLNDALKKSKGSIGVPVYERVKIPANYIRTISVIEKEFKLHQVIDNDKLVRNLYYSLQYLNYINYVYNTFCIVLGIRTLFFKYAVIHTYSIYEGILSGVNDTLGKECIDCKKHASCDFFLPKSHDRTFTKIVRLSEKKLQLSNEFITILKSFKESRDLVHIHTIEQSDHQNDHYELKLKDGYRGLVILRDELIPKVKEYKMKRSCKCFKPVKS